MLCMLNRTYAHFSRYTPLYLWLIVGCIAFGRSYAISFNLSDSLPGTVFLIEKNQGLNPEPGETIAFLYEGGAFYRKGAVFVKITKGLPGSIITSTEVEIGHHDYFVNDVFVGRTKPYSQTGIPIKRASVGIVPEDHYYMAATHPDSLDSRYELVGWVRRDQIIGRAHRVF